ncbi:MAG: tyrosine-type recombinase/integrase [Chlamydiales bacterium]|nr:tyrosine-type recombinase/integrase [Chlamydiales bacterium]
MATIQKRKKKNGTYSYRVMIRQSDGFPPTYKTFPTRQEAKDWAQQEEARRRQGTYLPHKSIDRKTLEDLIDRYLTIVLPTKPKNAKDTCRQLTWWKSRLGKYAVHNITPDLIATFRQELAETLTPKGKVRSPSTVNRYLAALSSALSYGVKECGWLQNNPCLRVTKFKEAPGRDRVASEEECVRLLRQCEQSRNKHLLPIVLLGITTGMRKSEITKLTWDRLDLERGLITLKETKSGRPRTVSLIGRPLEILRERFLCRKKHSPYVFPAKKRFGHICIRKAWDEACKRARVANLRFHDLRHTFATYAAEEGASNLELAAALGHQTLQMLQRYTHMNAKITSRLSQGVHDRIIGTTHEEKLSQDIS